jgi:glutathione synthetase
MSLLFVADPLEAFKTYKDTTFAMMREAARRGHELWACEPADLVWVRGARVVARHARAITLTGDDERWFDVVAERELALADVQAVLMRKDPPFDSEYFYATHLLQQAEREGARVFNKPAALRDHPEKLAILEFPEWITPTLVTRSEHAVRAVPRRARRHHRQAARRHGGPGHLPRRRRRHEPRRHRRDDRRPRQHHGDGAALPAGDRARRQAHPADRW